MPKFQKIQNNKIQSKNEILLNNLLREKCAFFCYRSDKTIRVWKWHVGCGFLEESYSPLLGHKYGITSVKVSPQVCNRPENIF